MISFLSAILYFLIRPASISRVRPDACQNGYSTDRPDLRLMILGVLIDGDGRPVCTEMWPGNPDPGH